MHGYKTPKEINWDRGSSTPAKYPRQCNYQPADSKYVEITQSRPNNHNTFSISICAKSNKTIKQKNKRVLKVCYHGQIIPVCTKNRMCIEPELSASPGSTYLYEEYCIYRYCGCS